MTENQNTVQIPTNSPYVGYSWQLKLSKLSKCSSLFVCGHTSFTDVQALKAGSTRLSRPILADVKDLGVFIDCRLTFSAQIDLVISKAKQRIF